MIQQKITQQQAFLLARFEKFTMDENGVYPAGIAALKLKMTPQGVFQAAERGHIKFISNGKNRLYGRTSVVLYKEYRESVAGQKRVLLARARKL